MAQQWIDDRLGLVGPPQLGIGRAQIVQQARVAGRFLERLFQ
jgi:hypothetical protein